MERNCWYCHKPLPLTKLLKRNLFCSSDHEERYFDEQSTAAFERMKEPEPPQQPAALDLKPPEIEQPPAENFPPMAPYLKPEVFAREARRLAIALEDPLDMLAGVAEPAQPLSPCWQITPELASAGRIWEASATPSAMADTGGEFPSVPFEESKRDIPQMRSAVEPASVNSLQGARCIPVWNGRATGETPPHLISADASRPTTLSPRIVVDETRLQGNLSSTAAACSWALRTPALAPLAPVVFESPAAFTGGEIQDGPGTWTLNPPRPGAGEALAQGLTIPRRDAARHPAFHAHSQEIAVHFSRGAKLTGFETPSVLPCAWIHSSRDSIRPAKTDEVPRVAMSSTHECNPAVAIRPVDLQRSACRPAAAHFLEIQTSLVGRREIDSMAPAELTSTGQIATPRVRHEVPLSLPCNRAGGAWEHTHPASHVEQRTIRSIAPAELTSTGRIATPRVRHDVSLSLPCNWIGGACEHARPAESKPALPPAAVWTSEHNAAVTVRPMGVLPGACRPLTGNFFEILPGAVDTRRVDSLKPHVSHTFIRTADFRPAWADVLAGIAAVKFAEPTDARRRIADSPVPGLAQARLLEPIPGSVVAEPRTGRPIAAALHIGAQIDAAQRPIPVLAYPGTEPCLVRQTELPCRIPPADPRKAKVSPMRAGTAPAGGFGRCGDASTEPRVAPPIAIRVQPASLFAPPGLPANVAFGWARRTLVSNGDEFLAQQGSVTAPLQPVSFASGGPARPAVAVNRFPITRIPRSTPCFALDLQLQTVPYSRGQRIRL